MTSDLDGELAKEYLAECCDHLHTVETDLLAIEEAGAEIDRERINRVSRAVHSIQKGAGSFDLVNIRALAERMEEVLSLLRKRKMVPTPQRVSVLLRATDQLNAMLRNAGASHQADIAQIMAALAGLSGDDKPGLTLGGSKRLRVLLVEDDFASRLVLQTFLSRYGECHIAVNGREAVEAFRSTYEQGQRYDLICMDIMMPEMEGGEALRQVRAIEEGHGVNSTSGVKIIMTTAVEDIKEVSRCFRELCDAYLLKPIDLGQLLGYMKTYQLVR